MAPSLIVLALALVCLASTAQGMYFQNAYIQNVKSGRCVTINKDALLDPLSVSKCNCGPYQFWNMEDGEHVISEIAVHGYMDEFYGFPDNGKTVGIYDFTGLAWQKWRVNEDDDGNYAFVVQHTGKCLHQGSAGTIDQWTCDDSDASQKWKIVENPCGKLPSMPSGRFQLQNAGTGNCAVVLDNSNLHYAKLGTNKCNCENNYHYWTYNKKTIISEANRQCFSNHEPGSPGVTQCACEFGPIHTWRLSPTEDGSFNILSRVNGKCIKGISGSQNQPLRLEQCDRDDAEQKWRFYDACHPEPPPTPKPTPPPITIPTEAPTTLPPQAVNVIPSYLIYFFENGNMDWLTPTRYTLLIGGHWDQTTHTWYTVDGRQVKPDTEMWSIYFGDVKPSFLNVLFSGGKSWNEVFGWMTIDFFKTWTSYKPATTPPPLTKNVIPNHQVTIFTNEQMNWLTPTRYTLLVGGRWDPVTQVWYTVDGREVRPGTDMWTIYFGDAKPAFLNVLFSGGKSWNEVFGWMTIDFFKTWTSWKVAPIPAPITPPPQPKNVIPNDQLKIFTNTQMNWLTPTRYTLLVGGRWNPATQVYYTVDGKQIRPSTPEWTIYFADRQPSDLTVIFKSGGSWNDSFGWMTPTFFQEWTSWQEAKVPYQIHIVVPGYVPAATRQQFASGRANWLTPDRVNMLAGGQWTGSEYITKTRVHVTPGTPIWTTYFGSADSNSVNTLFGGPIYWDTSFPWLTDSVKNVPYGRFTDPFPWDSFFG